MPIDWVVQFTYDGSSSCVLFGASQVHASRACFSELPSAVAMNCCMGWWAWQGPIALKVLRARCLELGLKRL